MAERDEGQAVVAKMVLTGVPGAGKATILRCMADRYAHSSVRSGALGGAEVLRTEFYWPELLPDGRRLRVRLFAVSGSPSYNAVDELLLDSCDGIVFVTAVSPGCLERGREALRTLVFNAGRNGFALDSQPIVLLYTKIDQEPDFRAELADEALGIPAGSVARFASGLESGRDLCEAVEWVVEWMIRDLGAVANPVAS